MTLSAVVPLPHVTIFTCPRAFTGDTALRQDNALASWAALDVAEILLLGDDEGVAEAARRFGCKHVPDVRRNDCGTPLLPDIFRQAEANAAHALMAYVNADILMPPEFIAAIAEAASRFGRFMLAGRRWNARVTEDFTACADWRELLARLRHERGVLFTPDAIDYFVFPKGALGPMPPFAIGRFAWDNWIIRQAGRRGLVLLDATPAVGAVHQDHDYGHLAAPEKDAGTADDPECRKNRLLLAETLPGTNARNGSVACASWRLTPQGLHRNWTAERMLWYARTWANDVRLSIREAALRCCGERAFPVLLRCKRRLCGGKTVAASFDADVSRLPVFIISYNRLDCLRQLVAWLERAGCGNIHIVDNASTYPPLLAYLEASPHHVTRLRENMGHLAVWRCGLFDGLLRKAPYAVSDCDVLPDKSCPMDALSVFARHLAARPHLTKVGFSLKIDDLPECNLLAPLVREWEAPHWKRRYPDAPLFDAKIDTTFALYRPGIFPSDERWWRSARTSPPYVARHLPWYADTLHPNEETRQYRQSLNAADTHWSAGLPALSRECHRLTERVAALEAENALLRRSTAGVCLTLVRRAWAKLRSRTP